MVLPEFQDGGRIKFLTQEEYFIAYKSSTTRGMAV
jgi:hypothetical protein